MCILTNLCSPARPPKAHLFVQCPRTTAINQYSSIVSHGRICLVNSLNDVSRYHISGKMMKHGIDQQHMQMQKLCKVMVLLQHSDIRRIPCLVSRMFDVSSQGCPMPFQGSQDVKISADACQHKVLPIGRIHLKQSITSTVAGEPKHLAIYRYAIFLKGTQ